MRRYRVKKRFDGYYVVQKKGFFCWKTIQDLDICCGHNFGFIDAEYTDMVFETLEEANDYIKRIS